MHNPLLNRTKPTKKKITKKPKTTPTTSAPSTSQLTPLQHYDEEAEGDLFDLLDQKLSLEPAIVDHPETPPEQPQGGEGRKPSRQQLRKVQPIHSPLSKPP